MSRRAGRAAMLVAALIAIAASLVAVVAAVRRKPRRTPVAAATQAPPTPERHPVDMRSYIGYPYRDVLDYLRVGRQHDVVVVVRGGSSQVYTPPPFTDPYFAYGVVEVDEQGLVRDMSLHTQEPSYLHGGVVAEFTSFKTQYNLEEARRRIRAMWQTVRGQNRTPTPAPARTRLDPPRSFIGRHYRDALDWISVGGKHDTVVVVQKGAAFMYHPPFTSDPDAYYAFVEIDDDRLVTRIDLFSREPVHFADRVEDEYVSFKSEWDQEEARQRFRQTWLLS